MSPTTLLNLSANTLRACAQDGQRSPMASPGERRWSTVAFVAVLAFSALLMYLVH